MNARETEVYSFGPFVLVPRERRLARNGAPVALAAKAFDLLVALVRNPGRLVGKDALLEEVWPGVIVEEVNLTVNVSALRKALGADEGRGDWIEPVPRHGLEPGAAAFVRAERLAQGGDVHGQVHLFHDYAGPDFFQQRVLAHQPAVVAHQRNEQVEGLGRERDRRAVPGQPPFPRDEYERSERVDLRFAGVHPGSGNPQAKTRKNPGTPAAIEETMTPLAPCRAHNGEVMRKTLI